MRLTLPLLFLFSTTVLSQDDQQPLSSTEVCTDGTGCTNYGEMPDPKEAEAAETKKGWVGPEKCKGQFCLYSNRDFAGGRGISAITNQKCFHLLKAVGQRLETVAQKHWDVDIAKSLVSHEDGKGAVALEDIPSGTALFSKVPVILVNREFYKQVPKEEQGELLESAVLALKSRTRKLFKSQMSHLPGEHSTESILRENAYEINIGVNDNTGLHWGNYPELSKFPHSCDPKGSYNINYLTLVHSSAANQDIKAGEAITLSQLDHGQIRSKRQDSAQKMWGHGCTCSKCSMSKAASKESDERLRLIASLEKKLESHETKVVNTDMIDNLLDLYKAEQFWSRTSAAYTLAATNYNGLGLDRKARKYAQMAVRAGTIQNGPDHGDVHIMRALWGDPKGHFTYKERLPNRGKGKAA